MRRLPPRGRGARKMRAGLTILAVALGVALIAGTYVLTDTINKSFDDIFQTASKGTDVSITARDAVQSDNDNTATTIPASFARRVEQVPGVAKVSGSMDTQGALFDPKGKRIGGHGAPTLIFSTQPQPFSPLTYPEGHAPQADDEVALLKAIADAKNVELGDTVSVVGNGPRQRVRVVGLAKYGGVTALGGAAVVVTTLHEAQRLAGTPGQLNQISVAAKPGVEPAEL